MFWFDAVRSRRSRWAISVRCRSSTAPEDVRRDSSVVCPGGSPVLARIAGVGASLRGRGRGVRGLIVAVATLQLLRIGRPPCIARLVLPLRLLAAAPASARLAAGCHGASAGPGFASRLQADVRGPAVPDFASWVVWCQSARAQSRELTGLFDEIDCPRLTRSAREGVLAIGLM